MSSPRSAVATALLNSSHPARITRLLLELQSELLPAKDLVDLGEKQASEELVAKKGGDG